MSVASNPSCYLVCSGLDTDTVVWARWPDPDTLGRLDGKTEGDVVRSGGGSGAFCAILDAHGGTFTSRSHALGAIPDLAYHFGDQSLLRVAGGNERLPLALDDAIGRERIHLGLPVTGIDQSGSRIRVATDNGREFSGDAVICTIPWTVLPDVAVTPTWSNVKPRLVRGMDWDNTTKVVAQTRTPAWLPRLLAEQRIGRLSWTLTAILVVGGLR